MRSTEEPFCAEEPLEWAADNAADRVDGYRGEGGSPHEYGHGQQDGRQRGVAAGQRVRHQSNGNQRRFQADHPAQAADERPIGLARGSQCVEWTDARGSHGRQRGRGDGNGHAHHEGKQQGARVERQPVDEHGTRRA